MKKVFLIMLSLISFLLFSEGLEGLDLNQINESSNNNKVNTTITINEGVILKITSESLLLQSQLELIKKTYNTFFNWENFDINEAEFIFDEGKLSILLRFNSILYKEIDLSQYLPSGIQMYYESFYEYDFRMFKDLLFMRLKGQFYSKESFLEELYNAASDPILYVQVHDPSYLIRQIEDLRSTNREQYSELELLKEQINELFEKNSELLELLSDTQKEISNNQEIQMESTNLLTDGVLSLANTTLFGSLAEYNKDHINRAIELKKETPDISVKELSSVLKNEGIKLNKNVIEAIFIIYFGEFPQNS